jgi:selenocysteine lyase/cysteine desulfurase
VIGPLSEQLLACRIAHTIRRGQLRLGLHAYNNSDDVDRAVAAVREGLAITRAKLQA